MQGSLFWICQRKFLCNCGFLCRSPPCPLNRDSDPRKKLKLWISWGCKICGCSECANFMFKKLLAETFCKWFAFGLWFHPVVATQDPVPTCSACLNPCRLKAGSPIKMAFLGSFDWPKVLELKQQPQQKLPGENEKCHWKLAGLVINHSCGILSKDRNCLIVLEMPKKL